MIDRNLVSRFRIDRRNVGSFVKIATITSQREIGNGIILMMLGRDDVFDVKRQIVALLGQSAIFAPMRRAFPDDLSGLLIHSGADSSGSF